MNSLAKMLIYRAAAAISRAELQPILDKTVAALQLLQGIGAGSCVASSGEEAVIYSLRPYVAGKAFFDVGANIGNYSAAIFHAYGATTTIHAFEPSRAAFARLQERFNQTPNIMLNQCALSDTEGKITLFADSFGSGTASIYRRRLDHFGVAMEVHEEVESKRLDDYCDRFDVKEIGLLKLDVEGHEMAVLRGAGELLKSRKIFAVQFEFGGCNIDSRTFFQDFWYFLTAHGFHIYRMLPSGQLFSLPAYREIYEQFRTTNYFATLLPIT